MTTKENLLRLIDKLPSDKLEEVERLVVSMLPPEEPTPGTRMSFEEAMAYTFETFDDTLRRLVQ